MPQKLCLVCGFHEDEVEKMHYFPSNALKSKRWQEMMGMKYLPGLSLKNYLICKRHFSSDSYVNLVTWRLRQDAVPTLFPCKPVKSDPPEQMNEMPTQCCLKHCHNNFDNTRNLGISFHRFPKNPELRAKWVAFCKESILGSTISDLSRICSVHFKWTDFERDLRNELIGTPLRKILNEDAVPSLLFGSNQEDDPHKGNQSVVENIFHKIQEEEEKRHIENLPLTEVNEAIPKSELSVERNVYTLESEFSAEEDRNALQREVSVEQKHEIVHEEVKLECQDTWYNLHALSMDVENSNLTQNEDFWAFSKKPTGICCYYVADEYPNVTRSILIKEDMTVEIRARDRIVQFDEFKHVGCFEDLLRIMTAIGTLALCRGDDDGQPCSSGFAKPNSSQCDSCHLKRRSKNAREFKRARRAISRKATTQKFTYKSIGNNTEKVRCRTCLEIVNTKQSIEVTRKCYLDKTIKDTILIFVPEMVSTLFDWDVICKTCYGILKSSLQFIKRCLEVEFTIADENKCLEEDPLNDSLDEVSESKDNLGNSAILYVDLDHNYYCTNSPTAYLKDSENLSQHNGSTTCHSSSATDEKKNCDLMLESKVHAHLDSALSVSKQTGELTMSCETCSEKFSPDDYQLHLDIHPPFICHQCGKGFKTRQSCMSHLRIHNGDSHVLCDICGRFGNFHLDLHKATHKKERPYMCHKCPKTYKTKLACETHKKLTHKRDSQQQCHECGKTFLTLGKCQMHYRLKHLKLTPFVCEVCEEKFGRKDYLQRHMLKHTSESEPRRRGKVSTLGIFLKHTGKPVTCKICGKKIASLNALTKHLRTHTKMNRYKCRHCNFLFTTSSNRDRHEKNNHNGNSEHKFRCNICWKRMKTEEELEVHLLVHKKRPPRYSCETCGKQFYKSFLLYNHRMEEHVSPEDIEEAEREIVRKNLLEYAQTKTSSVNKVEEL